MPGEPVPPPLNLTLPPFFSYLVGSGAGAASSFEGLAVSNQTLSSFFFCGESRVCFGPPSKNLLNRRLFPFLPLTWQVQTYEVNSEVTIPPPSMIAFLFSFFFFVGG